LLPLISLASQDIIGGRQCFDGNGGGSMPGIAYVGQKNHFFLFLRQAYDGPVLQYDTMETAGADALANHYDAVIAVAAPNALLPSLSYEGMRCYAELRKAGIPVYAEMYDAGDYNSAMLFGFISESGERAFYNEYLVWNETLLQARCQTYLPGRLSRGTVLVSAEDCIGSHTPVIPATKKFPVIVQYGSFTYSAMRLSAFDRLTMLPHSRWCELYGAIFSPILGVDQERVAEAFCTIWKAPMLAGKENTIRKSVERAVAWHFDSGLMIDRTGSQGCYEMIRSHDLHLRHNHRVDVMLLTAALFCSAGKYLSRQELVACGRQLADHCFRLELQETEGANRGIFHWYETFGLDRKQCYTSDNGRDGMAMLQLYKMTGDPKYLASVKALGDAYLRWTDGLPYFKTPCFSLSAQTLDTVTPAEPRNNAPVFYEGMAIVLANLYRLTGDGRYKDQLKLTADAMYAQYPNYSAEFSPLSKSFLYSRLITVLCAAQEVGCGNYSGLINDLLDFFATFQSPCGGIRESELVMSDETFTHTEFSVSMGSRHDSIMDILYCLNNLLGCFSLIRSMENPCQIDVEKTATIHKKLIRFALDIQLVEEDKRLHGGWMRAFDMQTHSYFGVNKDKDWGAYCVMGGWVMGFIPMLLMSEEGIPSIYSIAPEQLSTK